MGRRQVAKPKTGKGKPAKNDKGKPKSGSSTGSGRSKTIITLAMIVKNESKIITRLLSSCENIVSNICIVDTGSTDNTIEIITQWAQEHHIEAVIPEVPFKNFGYNRTRSFQLAREHFPQSDYFLLLDADMILQKNKHFNPNMLTKKQYLLEQVSSSSRYWNTRLIRKDCNWQCIGVTHEFWRSNEDHDSANYNGLWIDDREDGGAKADKFIRDNRLFKEELVKENVPDDLRIRYHYYLGQTLMSIGSNESRLEAIMYFKIRAQEKISFEEEGWYAQYRIGECYLAISRDYSWRIKKLQEMLGKIKDNDENMVIPLAHLELDKHQEKLAYQWMTLTNDNFDVDEAQGLIYRYKKEEEKNISLAVHNHLLAYDRRSWRVEPLYEIICYYRLHAKNRAALSLCEIAKNIKFPSNDSLFVSYTLYEYKIDIEMMINAYYVPEKKYLGLDAAQRCLRKILQNEVNDYGSACHIYEQSKWYDVAKMRDRCKLFLKNKVAQGQVTEPHFITRINGY